VGGGGNNPVNQGSSWLFVICFLLLFQVLAEIRPYLSGTGGGILELVQINDYVVKVRLSGPAAGVMTVRVALTQKLREKIPAIAAVQLIE
jgi:Fe-S cluster biogenesis protein NfuA